MTSVWGKQTKHKNSAMLHEKGKGVGKLRSKRGVKAISKGVTCDQC